MRSLHTKAIINGAMLLACGMVALIALLPFASVFINSFVDPRTAGLGTGDAAKVLFLPFPISLKQYLASLVYTRETVLFFWNSVFLTVPILFGGIVFSLLSGYGLAKFQFPCKKALFFCYVLVMLLPVQINVVGSYIFFDKLNLIGRYIGVILPGIFSSFGAFLMYQFIKNVADNELESARLESATELQVFTKIVIPQVKPGIASMLILMLIDCWNMVEMPMSILREERLFPLSIMLRYVNTANPEVIFASVVVFSIPLLLIFFMAQDQLTEGIKQSGQIALGNMKE